MNWKLSQDGLSASRTLDNGGMESRLLSAIDSDELIQALPADIIAPDYRAQRAALYPPYTEYLDSVVKGDKAQMQSYIDACLAIKLKYPKV